MKLIIQRVEKASVVNFENKKVVGQISKGLFILIGIADSDNIDIAKKMASKISKMRIMSDKNNKMNLSIVETTKEVLVVSQFTLYANTKDGNRPSFVKAAKPEVAIQIYEEFINSLISLGLVVQSGSFGKYMKINAILDGPVTIIEDTDA